MPGASSRPNNILVKRTTRQLNEGIMDDVFEKNKKGEYISHLSECEIIVQDSCSKETKEHYQKLKA